MAKAIPLAEEAIISKIYLIRGTKVMLDRDLAELYGVETKQLKRQVKRNMDRFPGDFMFEWSAEEFQEWRSQFGTSNEGGKMGLRYAPYVFTEQGVAMLSSVLNSERAIKVNIQIMRIYTKTREMMLTGSATPAPGRRSLARSSPLSRALRAHRPSFGQLLCLRLRPHPPAASFCPPPAGGRPLYLIILPRPRFRHNAKAEPRVVARRPIGLPPCHTARLAD